MCSRDAVLSLFNKTPILATGRLYGWLKVVALAGNVVVFYM